MLIPKHILQIAIGKEYLNRLPVEIIKNNLLDLNPSFEYTLLTDSTCEEFLNNNFKNYIEPFKQLRLPQHKSDLIRMLYLYKFGGYYVDIDLLPTVSFDTLNTMMNSPICFFTVGAHTNYLGVNDALANGFIGTIPENVLFMEFINGILRNINPPDFGDYIRMMYSTIVSHVGNIIPYTSINNMYILKEEHVSNTNEKYIINSKPNTMISYSNGHGYPYVSPK